MKCLLYHVFNPREFDAEEWARDVQEAGDGYIVFTTKHHDGFCMFDSKYTDYLHITQAWSGRTLRLPPLPCKVVGATLLTGGDVKVAQADTGLHD